MTSLAGRRWLVVTEEDVLPVDSGGRVDQAGMLRAARDAGVAVRALVPTRDFDRLRYAAELAGIEAAPLPRRDGLRHHASRRPFVVATRGVPTSQLLTAAGPERDAVISASVRSAELGVAIARAWRVPHLVRCQNLDSAYFRDLAGVASGPRRLGYALEARRLARFEAQLNASTAVTAFADISSEEATRHRALTRHPVLHVPAFALPLDVADGADTAERSGVLFVGSLDVETNQQALTWFLTHVWPAIRVAAPDALLRIVGRRPSAALRAAVARAAAAGVALHADVADVRSYLHAAAVAVNPARTGSGVNVKLLQAMAGGAAAVSTSAGASGIAWTVGEDLFVADAPEDFARAVVRLLADPALRDRVAARGRATVRDTCDPARNLHAIAAVLDG